MFFYFCLPEGGFLLEKISGEIACLRCSGKYFCNFLVDFFTKRLA